MTKEEFYETNCLLCGSIMCPRDEEAISTCGYYNGDIEGIVKQSKKIENTIKWHITDGYNPLCFNNGPVLNFRTKASAELFLQSIPFKDIQEKSTISCCAINYSKGFIDATNCIFGYDADTQEEVIINVKTKEVVYR